MSNILFSLLVLMIVNEVNCSQLMQLALGVQPAQRDQRQKTMPRQLSTEISKAEVDQVLSAAPEEVLRQISCAKKGRLLRFDFSPDCLIFSGSPGTGKFKSALSIAHKTKMKCFAYSSYEISDGSRGSGIENIRRIFGEAKKHSPCILIIKNLEHLIEKSKEDDNVEEYMWPYLYSYLKDDHKGGDKVHFIGTVDDFYKMSQYHRQFFCYHLVQFDLPKLDLRRKALEYHVGSEKGISFDDKLSCEQLAAKTDGFSYRELKSVVKKAKIRAMARPCKAGDKEVVLMEDCLVAVKRIDKDCALMGKKRESVDPITLRDCVPYVLGVGVAVVALFTIYKAKPVASTATAAAK